MKSDLKGFYRFPIVVKSGLPRFCMVWHISTWFGSFCVFGHGWVWSSVVAHSFEWFRMVLQVSRILHGLTLFTWFWKICVICMMCSFCNLVWFCRVILIWYTCLKILVSKLHLRWHFVQITFDIFLYFYVYSRNVLFCIEN